jgi:hypothetical protein
LSNWDINNVSDDAGGSDMAGLGDANRVSRLMGAAIHSGSISWMLFGEPGRSGAGKVHATFLSGWRVRLLAGSQALI